jgi:hypothetical protein
MKQIRQIPPPLVSNSEKSVCQLDARDITGSLLSTHPVDCDCEDLNDRAPTAVEVNPVAAGWSGMTGNAAISAASAAGGADRPTGAVAMSPAAARRLRLLFDVEGAALAAASLLLDRPHPEVLATLNTYVDPSARTMATTTGESVVIPEYARSLLRGWAGHWLVPREWVPTWRNRSGYCASRKPSATAVSRCYTPTPPRCLRRLRGMNATTPEPSCWPS